MCAGNPYKKYGNVISDLMKLGSKNQSYALRRFAILHQDDEEVLFNIAVNEENKELRSIAVQKISEEEKLLYIAQSSTTEDIKAIAISKIYDRKKLMHLRLSESSSLQQLIYDQFQKANLKIEL